MIFQLGRDTLLYLKAKNISSTIFLLNSFSFRPKDIVNWVFPVALLNQLLPFLIMCALYNIGTTRLQSLYNRVSEIGILFYLK